MPSREIEVKGYQTALSGRKRAIRKLQEWDAVKRKESRSQTFEEGEKGGKGSYNHPGEEIREGEFKEKPSEEKQEQRKSKKEE